MVLIFVESNYIHKLNKAFTSREFTILINIISGRDTNNQP